MEIPRIEAFLDYYGRLRERTWRVVDLIPPERVEWAAAPGAFTFGDILRHLGAIERYVFAENANLRPSRYPGHGRELADGWDDVRAFLERTHCETVDLLRGLSPDDLRRTCETPAGNPIPVWKWLRALAEHEVHHRGQIYLMLRMMDVATPPMYGLTSEEVRERSLPLEGGGAPDHFSVSADAYAAHRPGYPLVLADHLADLAPRRGLAWDAGCGSGQLSVLLGNRFKRVIATDASAEQIARARPHPSVEYRCAPAELTGLPASSVDLAVAAQAAHWFDIEAYYAEVRRVAAPGASVALVTYGLARIDKRVDAVVDAFYSDVLGPHWPSERRHVEVRYRSLPFPFEEVPLPRLEIRVEWPVAAFLGYIGTWSAVRVLVEAGGDDAVRRFRRELTRVWGGEPREVHWPLSVRAGRVWGGPRDTS